MPSTSKSSICKGSILLYMLELSFSRKLKPKNILVYRNALHLPLLHGFHINTKDKEFSMLAHHQFIFNHPCQHLIPNWNPSRVLTDTMLERSEYNILTSHYYHSKLLSKTLVNRTAEIAAFSRHSLTFSPNNDQVTIPVRPGFLYKNQSLTCIPPNVVIPALHTPQRGHSGIPGS